MLKLEDIREIVLHHQDQKGADEKLLGQLLQFMASVQQSAERGLVIVLELPEDFSHDDVPVFQKQATDFFQSVFPDEQRVSVILTAERQAQAQPQPKQQQREVLELPHIKHIIAVSSGKGGVGKSTVSVNLAVSLAKQGLEVGLLDADIHGPSQPQMLGVDGKAYLNKDNQIVPQIAHGVKTMSIGYLMENDGPVVWRGPMVQRALIQMLRDVDWGSLDILILDLPPGTGDIPLTLSQKVPLSGAVIVSTPQDIALLDAMKGLEMFQKLDVNVFGLIENMSMFECPHCHETTPLFGHGGARHEAEQRNIPFLGEIPLKLDIREAADAGKIVDGASAKAFESIAQGLLENLNLDKETSYAV